MKGGEEAVAYEMTMEERRTWWSELERTQLEFMQMELRNRNIVYSPERRKDLDKCVAELKQRYPFVPER